MVGAWRLIYNGQIFTGALFTGETGLGYPRSIADPASSMVPLGTKTSITATLFRLPFTTLTLSKLLFPYCLLGQAGRLLAQACGGTKCSTRRRVCRAGLSVRC